PFDLLPRAGGRAVRDRHRYARLHRRRIRRTPGSTSDASALDRAAAQPPAADSAPVEAAGGERMSDSTEAQAIQAACEHHAGGRIADAERLCRDILKTEPDHPEALHLLGAIEFERGNVEEAIELIGHAVVVDPSEPEALNDLGEAFRTAGKYVEAA